MYEEPEEDLIVRWAVAEIFRHLRMKRSPATLKFVKTTRIHKILYNTFEELNIPVTRSWFRYGCFIHSKELQSGNLGQLRSGYIRTKNLGSRLGRLTGRLGIDLRKTEQVLWKNTDAMPARIIDYLDELYGNAPQDFRNIYNAKFKLNNTLHSFSKVDRYNSNKYLNWLSQVRNDISDFHSSVFSLSYFSDMSDFAYEISEVLEEALIKGLLLAQNHKLTQKKMVLLCRFDEFCDEYVWSPFAYGISAITVKGSRSEEVRRHQNYMKKIQVEESNKFLSSLNTLLSNEKIRLSWQESINWYKSKGVDKDFETKLLTMQKIYEQSEV